MASILTPASIKISQVSETCEICFSPAKPTINTGLFPVLRGRDRVFHGQAGIGKGLVFPVLHERGKFSGIEGIENKGDVYFLDLVQAQVQIAVVFFPETGQRVYFLQPFQVGLFQFQVLGFIQAHFSGHLPGLRFGLGFQVLRHALAGKKQREAK